MHSLREREGCSPKNHQGLLPEEEGMLPEPTKTTGPHKDLTEYLGGENGVKNVNLLIVIPRPLE